MNLNACLIQTSTLKDIVKSKLKNLSFINNIHYAKLSYFIWVYKIKVGST